MIRGADFSSYQDRPALERALEEGLRFAFVKLTQGTGYVSPAAAWQLGTLRAHGLRLGVYHYLDAGPGGPQWRHFQRQLERLPHHQELALALDYEAAGATSVDAAAFLAAARKAGYRVGEYSSRGTHAYAPLGQAWRWVASWGKRPPGPWSFWQFQAGEHGGPDWDVFVSDDPGQLETFWREMAGRRFRYRVRFTGKPHPIELGPYRTLRRAAAAAIGYALRHPRRPSFQVTRSG